MYVSKYVVLNRRTMTSLRASFFLLHLTSIHTKAVATFRNFRDDLESRYSEAVT
jgi:hypothetical protein